MLNVQKVIYIQANKKIRVIDIYKGDFIILDDKGLEIKRSYKKLDNIYYGLYKVKNILKILY